MKRMLPLCMMACSWLSPVPDASVETEGVEERERNRRRKGPRLKENTPVAKAFQTTLNRDFEAHVLGGEGGPRGKPDHVRTPLLHRRMSQQVDQLAALGYVDGEIEAAADRVDGVKVFEHSKVQPGYNLFSPGGTPVALLLDMNGVERHRWSFRVKDAWPDFTIPRGEELHAESFRRAQLMPNGDLVALWSGYGIVRIDKESQLVWGNFLPVHHDLHVEDDGRVVVLTRAMHRVERYGDEPIVEDFVTWLTPEGRVDRTISVLSAFEAYDGFDEVWRTRPKKDPDLFHTNTLYVLEQDYPHPAFKKGRLLTSMRHLSTVALIDPETAQVVWHLKATFDRQHDPQMTHDGHVLIFDNRGGEGETSRMLEYDPVSGDLVWSYQASPPSDFATGVCGHAQRLDNGNTLINDSTAGRAFEVDPSGHTVWSYTSPWRATRQARLVSRNYEFWRVPRSMVDPWLSP